jgi:branched-chain amino acid transport system permease protein
VSAHFLDIFGIYGFAIRIALVLSLAAYAVYILLNAGIFAVPQVGLMAVGGYTAAILTLDAQWSFPLAVAGGALAGTVAGLVLAGLLGRLNGIYLAIATLAFSEAVSATVLNIPRTGLAQGRVGIPRETTDLTIVVIVVIVTVLLWALSRSRLGMAIVAVREDALMARHQGINVFLYRVGLFGLAGLMSGLAGALHVHLTGYVEPTFFSFELLSQLIAAVVIGGTIYVAAPLVGMTVISALPQLVTALGDFDTLANGAIIVLVMQLAPHGLIGSFVNLREYLSRRTRSVQDASSGATESQPPRTRREARPTEARPAVIELNDISMYFGGVKALQGVSLRCSEGELLGIIGPNGSGKTTLLNVISGVYAPSGGSGILLGHSMEGAWGHPHRLARLGVSRTFQTIRLIDSYTVRDNVMIGLHGRALDGAGSLSRADTVTRLLEAHGLGHLADLKAGALSYGMRRRVEIARALASQPKLLLLDEPTAGMDPQERRDIFEMIADLLAQDIGIIVVEHDVASMGEYCDELIVLDFGKLLASGDPATVLQHEDVVRAYIGEPGPGAPRTGVESATL